MEPQGDALNWEAGERANDFAVCNVNVGFWHLGITVRAYIEGKKRGCHTKGGRKLETWQSRAGYSFRMRGELS